ncbi:MAG: serine hydrolase [Acidimicrobiaceae bacterium]|nr:serine hydrolase [Acidimicrobiaceae bacterium]
MKRLAPVLLSVLVAVAACSTAENAAPDPTPVATTAATATTAPSATTALSATTTSLASMPTTAPTTTAATADSDATADAATTAGSDASQDGRESDAVAEPADEPAAPSTDPLDAAVTEWMKRSGAPGLVLAVARGDREPDLFSWGVSDLGTSTPMSYRHHVRIGSVTKTVTAAVVLQLAAEGVVALDAPVAQYLGGDWAPGYEHAAEVTVRDLLGHTSGFVEYAFDPRFYQLAATRLDEQISPEEILEFAADYGPVTELGTEFNYNTTGYVAAGLVIEAVTGNSAAEELRSRVFEPLGLEHVYLTPEEFPPEPTANGYVGGTIGYLLGPLLGLTRDNQITHADAIFVDISTMPSEFARSAGWTGGGLEAQIGDVAVLMRGLFAGDILDARQVGLMTTGHPQPDNSYGLGISTEQIAGLTVFSHGGGVPGFRTIAAYIPELDLGIAMTANLLGIDGTDDVSTLLESLAPILATTN